MKVFITGPTGAGKTTLAGKLSEELNLRHIRYDTAFLPAPIRRSYPYADYPQMSAPAATDFLRSCGSDFIADNVAFDPTLETFNNWAADNDVAVWCVVPESKEEWKKRTPDGGHALDQTIWEYYWLEIFSALTMPVRYVLSPSGEEIEHDEAMERIGMEDMIRDYARTADHDYRYQDIPEIEHLGYSGTAESWRRIEGLIDWKGASVVDCGSFHGYFLFRAGDAGSNGHRIGLDFMESALTVSRAVNTFRGDTVKFRAWRAGEAVPKADVTLCMNALHHFPDDSHPLGTHCDTRCSIEKFFATIQSPTVLFEAYEKYEPAMRKRWNVSKYSSARPGRAIYLCQ